MRALDCSRGRECTCLKAKCSWKRSTLDAAARRNSAVKFEGSLGVLSRSVLPLVTVLKARSRLSESSPDFVDEFIQFVHTISADDKKMWAGSTISRSVTKSDKYGSSEDMTFFRRRVQCREAPNLRHACDDIAPRMRRGRCVSQITAIRRLLTTYPSNLPFTRSAFSQCILTQRADQAVHRFRLLYPVAFKHYDVFWLD